ncbi:spt2 chromatin protein [Phlyctema vagabunda]|uniref:Spt2 chromatin protein n=1 Tax=Phlyctema vagabunda TaxID=108571 RepID=A0ABR4P2Q7_9HELO
MPIGDLLAQISGEPSPTFPPATLPPKRKADDDLRRPVDKVQRTRPAPANTSKPVTQTRPTALDTSVGRMKISSSGRSPSVQTPATRPQQPTPPAPASAPKAPPKKGSYAEILARGKAAQASLGQVGTIKHKPIAKRPTKKEMEEAKTQRSANIKRGAERIGAAGKSTKPGQTPQRDGMGPIREGNGKPAPPVSEKKIKKAATATTGYAGTARPRPGATASSSKSSSSARREEPRRHGNHSNRYSYASAEDDDEDMDGEEPEEDDYGYESSDMEAAAFEVDEEEELAARLARQEDAAALAEENRLKREKEERKKKLMTLAQKSKR